MKTMTTKDELGDRVKAYESLSTDCSTRRNRTGFKHWYWYIVALIFALMFVAIFATFFILPLRHT